MISIREMRRLFSAHRPLFRYDQETPTRPILRFIEFLLFLILGYITLYAWRMISNLKDGWVKQTLTTLATKIMRVQPTDHQADRQSLLVSEKREAEKIAAEKREAEKLAAEKREAEKLAAEKREAEKIAAEKREAERLEAEENEALLEASVHYNESYRDRIMAMDKPQAGENPKPFLGFSLADMENDKGRACLVVDGVYRDGPASLVGVGLNDELVQIDGENVGSIAQARRLVEKRCHAAKVTAFGFQRHESNQVYTVKLWVMTTDETYRGRPFFFDTKEHVKDTASPKKLQTGHASARRLRSQPRLYDSSETQ